MKINIATENEKVIYLIKGSVDEIGAEELEKRFNELDVKSVKEIDIDLKGVDYIGSAGVGALLLLYKKIAPYDGKVVIRNIPKEIYTLLSIDMNLGQIFSLISL